MDRCNECISATNCSQCNDGYVFDYETISCNECPFGTFYDN